MVTSLSRVVDPVRVDPDPVVCPARVDPDPVMTLEKKSDPNLTIKHILDPT